MFKLINAGYVVQTRIIYDKDTEELGADAFNCSKCDERVAALLDGMVNSLVKQIKDIKGVKEKISEDYSLEELEIYKDKLKEIDNKILKAVTEKRDLLEKIKNRDGR